MMKLWMNVMIVLAFNNMVKHMPIDIQTSSHSIELDQGIIHESWNKISWLVPKIYTVHTGASYIEIHIDFWRQMMIISTVQTLPTKK